MYLGELEQFLLRTPTGLEFKALCLNPRLNGATGRTSAFFAPEDVIILTK
jgi:hypothetical protein